MIAKRKFPENDLLTHLMYCLAILGITAALAIGLFFGWNHFSLTLVPAGETEMTLDYGENYLEPGVRAVFRGTHFLKNGISLDDAVTREGWVDTATTGTYTITYRADRLWYHARLERVVHIVDRRPPELTLSGEVELYLLPGEAYEEPGFTAWDDYDGDLTAQVHWEEKDDILTYRVEDRAGNRTEKTRIIHRTDPIPPEITLLGEMEMTIGVATGYQEPGFTAQDNLDGDLTDQVTVDGTVDPYRSGEYTLTYTVADSFGNTTQVQRRVTVAAKPQPDRVNPEGKVIYLTFDDGPGPYTRQLLDVLDKYNAKATFFVLSNGYADLIGQIASRGHSVGIHSASHDYATIYAGEEAYFQDLRKVQAVILAQTGQETTLLRFPGGSSNTVSRFNEGIMTRLTQAVEDAGYQYFDWNVDSNDAGGAKTADEVYDNVVKGVGTKRIAIVLQHDVKDFSVEAVERILIWGLENGYRFLPLTPSSPTCHHNINN